MDIVPKTGSSRSPGRNNDFSTMYPIPDDVQLLNECVAAHVGFLVQEESGRNGALLDFSCEVQDLCQVICVVESEFPSFGLALWPVMDALGIK